MRWECDSQFASILATDGQARRQIQAPPEQLPDWVLFRTLAHGFRLRFAATLQQAGLRVLNMLKRSRYGAGEGPTRISGINQRHRHALTTADRN